MQLLANNTSPYVRIARIALAEKGVTVEPTVVDPWADDPRLRNANAATRVPTLITDDGTPLAESLFIVMWLERTHQKTPSLLGSGDPAGVLSRAGMAMGVIDAAVHTIITRKVTAPALFDDTPVGVRRRRSMAEGMERLEAVAAAKPLYTTGTPTIDAITAVVAIDYLHLRFPDAAWLPKMPALHKLSSTLRERASFANTVPRA